MNKFLNFSTILCSYILITLLVISCGDGGEASSNNDVNNGTSQPDNQPDDTGDISGGQGSAGSNSKVVQADLNDKTCLLSDRDDKDAVVAVLCQTDSFIGLITKTTPAGQEAQQLDWFIPSTESAVSVPPRIWDLSKGAKIQISYDKDYTLTVDEPTEGASQLGTLAAAADHTAEFPLQNLTIASLLNDTKEALRSGGITFSLASGSAIKVAIAPKLAVKSQADFISMGSVVSIPDLTQTDYKIPFALVNNLNLVAPGGEADKFDSAIIPEADASFDFDGGGYTISLNSEINTVLKNKPAAIIGSLTKASNLQNFTLDINKPISGRRYVATIVANASSGTSLQNIKININRSLSLYKYNKYFSGPTTSYVGGVLGIAGCVDINNVVVKTAKDVAIQADVKISIGNGGSIVVNVNRSGGLAGIISCKKDAHHDAHINNNVVDVTLGASHDNSRAYIAGDVHFCGLVCRISYVSEINNNLVKLAISRGNLPANFFFWDVSGLSNYIQDMEQVTNNLVYVDFSNLGRVQAVTGLFSTVVAGAEYNKAANNMVFIADGFTGSEVLNGFGVAIGRMIAADLATHFNDNFFSSPFTDNDYTTNAKLASFVYTAGRYFDTGNVMNMNFNNLILDNKDATVMFKAGTVLENLRGKVASASLFTLAEAKTTPIGTLFSAGNTSWEEGSQGYPQLKAPSGLTGSVTKAEIEAAWTKTNADIQTKLADREASQQ